MSVKNTSGSRQYKKAIETQKNSTKKTIKNLRLHRVACVAKIVLILSLLCLVAIGITSAARALTLVTIANENGIPGSWHVASVGNPDTITIDMTYFDQKMDSCRATIRQFEWCSCNQCIGALQQGIIKNKLGEDHLPIPTYTTQTESSRAGINKASQWVTGSDPVGENDNFYRWYHEVPGISKRYDRTILFNRVGNTNTYVYGGNQIFPLDDITNDRDSVSRSDSTSRTHNFSFTAHMTVPIKVEMNGHETFDFSGDDDVWVFLNDTLVLDIGGVHNAVAGSFTINTDGTITSSVNGEEPILIDADLEKNRVYNLDFFYAERSTSESNTKITITNMNWPITADAALEGEIIDEQLISYVSSLSNIDTENPLYLTHISSYLDNGDGGKGFLPLNDSLISYTYTPEDSDSWIPLEITAPDSNESGFKLVHPIALGKANSGTDVVYFKYHVLPTNQSGEVMNKIAYLTENGYGDVGISYDTSYVKYKELEPVTPATEEQIDEEEAERQRLEEEARKAEEERQRLEEEARKAAEEAERQRLEEEARKAEEERIKAEEKAKQAEEERIKAEEEAKKAAEEAERQRLEEAAKKAEEEVKKAEEAAKKAKEEAERQRLEEEARKAADELAKAKAKAAAEAAKPIPPVVPAEIANVDTSNALILDDADFAYLDPLGVIAYVPDTGVISEVSSAIFRDSNFATIITSQWFVLVVFAIFAISFAIYFPLRRY